MGRLVLEGVSKVYPGGAVAAAGVCLAIEPGERFVVVGPSGSGKSTLLRLVAGLETIDSGTICLDGRRIDQLAPRDRHVAMVFQGQVVYPHLDVFGNLAFGLRAQGRPRAEVDAAVRGVADRLGLQDCLHRRPDTLSGGQRQRVALGRALVLRPGVLLLDEPFNGLDLPLRARLRADLAELGRQFAITMLLVTHDQGEAMAFGDRLAVLHDGCVVQVDTPQSVYDNPANQFVARFLGHPPMNILPAFVEDSESWNPRVVGLPADHRLPDRPATFLGSGAFDLAIRAENVTLTADPVGLSTVLAREPTGSRTLLTVDFGPHRLAAWVDPRTPIGVGDRVRVGIDWSRVHWFPSKMGRTSESV